MLTRDLNPASAAGAGSSPQVWRGYGFVAVALLVIFFGAGRELWSQAMATLLIGASLLVAPSRYRLPWPPLVALSVLMLLPLSGLLPAEWLDLEPGWRRDLLEKWTLPLDTTVTAQVSRTLEAWVMMVAGLLWLWNALGQGFDDQERRAAVRLLALGGVFLAGASLVEHARWLEIPWWPRSWSWGEGFGPFANRNHIASLNAITCVLCAAAAHDAFRQHSRLWPIYVLGGLLPLAAIFANTSRAGLLLFFMGMMVWLGTLSMRLGLLRKLIVVTAVVIAVVSVVLVSGGQLSQRVQASSVQDLSLSPLRMDLAGDLLRLIAESPWPGAGLGSFPTIYTLVSGLHVPNYRIEHPESDVLLLLFELGWLTILPCLLFLVWWAMRTGPWKNGGAGRRGRRLRKAAAIAVGLALLHGVFDVPIHGVGYSLGVSVLLALSVRLPHAAQPTSVLSRWLFRGAGLALIVVGIGWLAIALDRWTPALPTVASRLYQQARQDAVAGRNAEALAKVKRALAITPLDYRLYFHRAQLLLALRQPVERALDDFGRARALEPHYAPMCLQEGFYWLSFSPSMAIIPWRECLRRDPNAAETIHGTYQQMLNMGDAYPELRPALWRLADRTSLQLLFLAQARPGEEWQRCLNAFLQTHPQLGHLAPENLKTLLRAWQERGDRTQLMEVLLSQPKLREHGWRVLVQELARLGRYREAFEAAVESMHLPARTSVHGTADIPRLERTVVLHPADLRPRIELYYAQRAAGDGKSARRTLEGLLELPRVPVHFKAELATLYAEDGDYRRAWEFIQQALQEGMGD